MVCQLSGWHRRKQLQSFDISQVHELCSFGRYREAFDSVWNLGAILKLRKINFRMICLTATLKQIHMPDIMRRLSVDSMVVFRRSCNRQGLSFNFDTTLNTENEVVEEVSKLAVRLVKEGKVLVCVSTVKLCDMVELQLNTMGQRQPPLMCAMFANILTSSNQLAGMWQSQKDRSI